jgi:lipopolysaccharide/colanic/teichoic acid biosynthesis glycosyltransferase
MGKTVATAASERRGSRARSTRPQNSKAKRCVDIVGAVFLLFMLLPILVVCALAIKLDSRGPVFYRCRRVGYRGRHLGMLKFRKMHHHAAGAALTLVHDDRFTRVGRLLAQLKLDELPQLWNVLRGDMSLIGPRPEDPSFVNLHREEYEEILSVRPGITGLSQLAFARESAILDPRDPIGFYTGRLLPQKMRLDCLYARDWTFAMDLRILWWTLVAVGARTDVAVFRETGTLRRRVRPAVAVGQPPIAVALEQPDVV